MLAEPPEAVDCGRGRDVFQGDVAGVVAGLNNVEVAVEIEGAGARLPASGVVRHLHVGDPACVRGQRGIDVVPVIGEMEQVTEEADVWRVDPVEDGNDVTSGS